MADAFVRQTALELILERAGELSPEEIKRAITLGLSDPDFNINEVAFNYALTNKLASKVKPEILLMAQKFSASPDEYYKQMGNKIVAMIQKAGQVKV